METDWEWAPSQFPVRSTSNMKLLKTYEVRADIFEKILYDFSYDTEYREDLRTYSYGYPNKQTIYYNKEYLICRETILDYYCNNIPNATSWKQAKLRKVLNAESKVQETITGTYAWNYMMKVLKKHYTEEEIYEIIKLHQCEKDPGLSQYHYIMPIEEGTVVKVNNCYKYDINGAHCDAVVSMFPRAEKSLMWMYNQRKEKPIYKQIFNYFVGEMVTKGFRPTYNWIVQRTTRKLFEAIDLTNGHVIYANTDGFIVQCPETRLNTSTKLFDFKLEYSGDVFVYRSNNYVLYQQGKDQKGSCRCEVRPEIDLRKGIVVDYKVKRTLIGVDSKGNERYAREIIDKQVRKVDIDEDTYCN